MSVTVKECAAMRLLARDGWTVGELKMTFQVTRKEPINKHVGGDCDHEHSVSYIRDWDGQNPPAKPPAKERM